MFINLLSVAHIVVAVLLTIAVLLHRSESDIGAIGGSNAVFTGKSASDILTKATTLLAILFMVISLLIVRESYHSKEQKSVVETMVTEELPLEQQEPALPVAE